MRVEMLPVVAAVFAVNLLAVQTTVAQESTAPRAVQTRGNVSFISGGVGEDDTAAMKSAAAAYSLELQFVRKATPRDEFLSDVKVTIRDRSRNVVLDTVTEGPFLLAKLPGGTYQVEAEHYGVTKRQTVNVSSGKRGRAMFVWTNQDDPSILSNAPN